MSQIWLTSLPSKDVGRSFVVPYFLKAQCLKIFCSMLAFWGLGCCALTACYNRYPSEVKYKTKIIEIKLKKPNRSPSHMFMILLDSD